MKPVTPSTQKYEIDVWKVYRSDKYTFEFKYPSEWEAEESEAGRIDIKTKADEKIISIVLFDPRIVGISYCEAHSDDLQRCELLRVDNKTAIIDWGLEGEANAITSNLSVTLYQVNTNTKGLFKEFISTFKFLD